MDWHVEFARWYIGGFMFLFGLFLAWKGQQFSMCGRFFYFERRDPNLKARFERVLARRDELEGDNTTAWRITGLTSVLLGVLVLVEALNPVVGYALLCALMPIVMSQVYMSMRNRSDRRAASLQPRTVYTSVPALWFIGGVVSAILPLALVGDPRTRVSAIIVACACAAVVILAARTSEMAALLAGEDPDIELYVDNRLRWSRVTGLLALCYAASYVFITMSTPSIRTSTPLIAAVQIASLVVCIGFAAWVVFVYFRRRMRAKASTV